MLRSLKELQGYTIDAIDGEIGSVYDFYFDDQKWTIRYLVVDTGNWLAGRRVLLSMMALGQPDWEQRTFPVSLTQEQVENSPNIDTNKPVSRQMEEDLHGYYGWAPYWRPAAPGGGTGAIAAAQIAAAVEQEEKSGTSHPHLRSTKEVLGYHIQATDGGIGHVEDFVTEDDVWVVRYMVVNTRNLLPGKDVLIAPTWVKRVNWAERMVEVDLSQETIQNSPEFDPSAPVNRRYELRLYDYYGRPKYWTRV